LGTPALDLLFDNLYNSINIESLGYL